MQALRYVFPEILYQIKAHEICIQAALDTVYPSHNTQTRMTSSLADDVLWNHYTSASVSHPAHISSALSRITFRTQSTATPLRQAVDLTLGDVRESATAGNKTLIVLAGRSRRMAVESLSGELRKLMAETNTANSMVAKTLGDLGAALIATNVAASLLILQAAPETL